MLNISKRTVLRLCVQVVFVALAVQDAKTQWGVFGLALFWAVAALSLFLCVIDDVRIAPLNGPRDKCLAEPLLSKTADLDACRDGVKVLQARYGSKRTDVDVTSTVQRWVSPDGALVIRPSVQFNSEFGGDPHPFCRKKLRLVALVDGKPFVAAIKERRTEDVAIGRADAGEISDAEESTSPEAKEAKTAPVITSMIAEFASLDQTFDTVKSEAFMRACECVADVAGLFGTSFLPVRANMTENIAKIRRHSQNHDSDLLSALLLADVKAGVQKKDGSATIAALWLKRVLDFNIVFMTEVVLEGRETQAAAEIAYAKAVQPWHGWLLQVTFKTGFNLVPERNKFFNALQASGTSANHDALIADLRRLVLTSAPLVQSMNAWFDAQGLNFPEKA